MGETKFDDIFTEDALNELFPSRRSDDFFEALLGDASAGAYDISLKYQGYNSVQKNLTFELHLRERPGKCLACNLTYGLPKVFGAHPVINIKGVVREIDRMLDGQAKCSDWSLQSTRTVTSHLHVIPLTVNLSKK